MSVCLCVSGEGQCPQGWGQLLAVSTEDRLSRNGLSPGHFILPNKCLQRTGRRVECSVFPWRVVAS